MKKTLKKISAILTLSLIVFFNLSFLAFGDTTNPPEEPAKTGDENTEEQPQSYQNKKTEIAKTELAIELAKSFKIFGYPPDAQNSEPTTSNKFQCLPPELIGGYFYTIIEEPLVIKDAIDYEELKKLTKTEKATYISKICYRNTLEYSLVDPTDPKERYHFALPSQLTTKCLDQDQQKIFEIYRYENDPNAPKVLYHCSAVQVLLSKGGTSLLEGYLKTIYSYFASLAGIIAVSIIVVSGIQIAAPGGSERVEEAKKRIIKSLIGIAILFLSGLILYTVNPNFFVRTPKTTQEQNTQPDSTTTNTTTTEPPIVGGNTPNPQGYIDP
jgi:hypothetical protein